MSTRPTFYILDAYSLIFQVFHAIDEMTGPAGQPTNAVFGIYRDVSNLIKNRKPDYLAAAFDGAGKVFRSDLFPEYKANRSETPVDLSSQIPTIRRVFDGFRVPILMQEGAEADDIIATLARRGVEKGFDVVICTADKDARQLLDEHTKILNLRKQEFMDPAALEKDWGVRPDQVVDLLALTGDTVDNVPGVPGIGIKTAATLLQQFGTLENLMENIHKVSGAKRKENLSAAKESVKLSKKLVQLKEDLDLPFEWDALKIGPYDAKALKQLCQDCGFHRFLGEIVDETPSPPWDMSAYKTIDSQESLDAFLKDLREQPRFCFDTETTSVDPLRADLVGLAFSWKEAEAYYIPVRAPMFDRKLDEEATLEALRPILEDPAVEKIGQNVKYDMLVLRRAGVKIRGPITDTMVLSYLLESGERNHNLDQMAKRLLDHEMIPITDLIGKGKNQRSMDDIEVARVAEYAGEDADATWRIEAMLRPEIEGEGLLGLYSNLERPLISVLAEMEAVGIKVDVDLLKKLSREFGDRLVTIEAEIYQQAGREFNIGSPQQLRQILFEELKLPQLQKTPGGEASTAVEVLEELALKHDLPRLLIQHRQLAKLKSTYLDTLPELVHPQDGRVHASFNQVVAATGRLSSSDPNLQNIPVRTEDGKQIRQAFIPAGPGWSLLTADYSQIELRILAHYSKDPALVKAFAEDHDIHSVVAAKIFSVPEAEVTSDQRRVAKTVNFGVIYGLSAFGLSARLGITQAEAGKFIEAYFLEYAGVSTFITETLETALAEGRVETILGRRRPISGIKSTTGRNRNLAERTAVNTVIQGSAADLIKKAMLLVDEAIREKGLKSRMLLQIHDELVFETPNDEVATLAALVKVSMTSALPLDVPLKVDIGVGPNWLDIREYEA